jgi:predicted Zn-dependent peptidase
MKKTIIISLLFLFANTLLVAQLDRSIRPVAGPAPEIKIASYESFTLKNGLQVFVVENHKQPVVSINLLIDRDPVAEKEAAGYISAASALLRTGTHTRTKAEIDEEIDFIGASLNTSSSGVNGTVLKKHLEKLLEIASDVIINSNPNQEELDKIKMQKVSTLKANKEEPSSIINVLRKKLYYGEGHPYSESETESSIDNITLELCKEYINTYFRPNIAYLAVVGDITKAEAEKLVEKYFGKWENKDVPKFAYKKPAPPLVSKVALIDRDNSVQSTVRVGHPIELTLNSPDYIKSQVTNTILGGGVFRLFKNLRETHGFTYGAYSSLAADQLVGHFTSVVDVRNSATDSAITEILFEMKRISKEPVEQDELTLAKNYMTGNFAISLENPQTIANFAINTAKYNLPKDFYQEYLKNLANVTIDDVLASAKKYIKPENSYILVVGKASEIADNLKKFSVTSKIDYYDIDGNKYDPVGAATVPEGITPESVFEKYVSVTGGKDNYLKVTDKKITMTAKVQGFDVLYTLSQKAPNKLLQVVSFGGMEQVILFDGEKGIQKSPMGSEELKDDHLEQLKFFADIYSAVNYKEYGYTYKVAGTEKVNQKDVYKIEIISPSGSKGHEYYEVESGYRVKEERNIETPQGNFMQVTTYNDYREVEGVKYPYKVIQNIAGMAVEFTVTSIEINTGLDDSLFKLD